MTNFNLPSAEITPSHINEAFDVAARRLQEDQILDGMLDTEIISHGPPSWVAAAPNKQNAALAVRLTHSTNPEQLLQATQTNVSLMQELRSAGAQVPNYLGEAYPVDLPNTPGGFVAAVSEYLPGSQASYHEYGAAIASLHVASTKIDLDHIPTISPLAPVEQQIDYLKERQEAGNPFQIGDTKLSKRRLAALEKHLRHGSDMLGQLFELTESQGKPLVVLQEDVHGQNVLQDKADTATLIDIEPHKGPAVLDFGRPLTDWHQRFGRPITDTGEFIDGYRQTVPEEMMPSTQEMRLAADYINIRSSLILFSLAINAVRSGHKGEEWMLQESIHRLNTINSRNTPWNGLDNARKKALRESQQ